MIETYHLQDNEWLKGLYKKREKWALAYGRETFCGDMITTQQSESMNSVIKKYINYKNELVEFFEHFERLLKDRRYKESRADFSNSQSDPSLSFPVKILVHAANIYTQKVYELFHKEVCKSHDCILEICGEKDTIVEFKVANYGKSFQHRVTYDSVDSSLSCSCKKFEFVGILCSHALKVLNFKQIVKIPDQYILKRWMKTAKKQNVKVNFQDMSHVDPKELLDYRYKDLCQYYRKLIARAAESQKRYEIAKHGLQKLMEQVNACSEEDDVQEQDSSKTTNSSNSDLPSFIEGGNSSGKKIRGIKCKERITYKTCKRPKSCLDNAPKRRKSKMSVTRSENKDSRDPRNEKLSLLYQDTLQNSYSLVCKFLLTYWLFDGTYISNCTKMIIILQDQTHYSTNLPYSIANVPLSQNPSSEVLKHPQRDVSLLSPNSFIFPSSVEQEDRFTDLLKTIDPHINDQQVSVGYKPEYLFPEPKCKGQEDWVKK